MVIGYLRDRIKQIIEKLYLTVSLAVSALEEKASRRSYAGCLFQMNVILFPIVLCIIVISSIVSAPILSAFTLPMYFLAYPRQLRFWPHSGKSSEETIGDGVYYDQMIPELVEQIHKSMRAGRLGILHPGSHLLARYEDRTVWIQVTEKGNGYMYYGAKGN